MSTGSLGDEVRPEPGRFVALLQNARHRRPDPPPPQSMPVPPEVFASHESGLRGSPSKGKHCQSSCVPLRAHANMCTYIYTTRRLTLP
jgi:hypothetical protein